VKSFVQFCLFILLKRVSDICVAQYKEVDALFENYMELDKMKKKESSIPWLTFALIAFLAIVSSVHAMLIGGKGDNNQINFFKFTHTHSLSHYHKITLKMMMMLLGVGVCSKFKYFLFSSDWSILNIEVCSLAYWLGNAAFIPVMIIASVAISLDLTKKRERKERLGHVFMVLKLVQFQSDSTTE
jgi:uncharacterized membrane protein